MTLLPPSPALSFSRTAFREQVSTYKCDDFVFFRVPLSR